jgi:4-hydroxybenzoate polyprenyltransferase
LKETAIRTQPVQIKSALRSLSEAFIYGNLLVALCGIALSLSSCLILGIELSKASIPALVLIFFSCLFIYNLNVFFLGEFDLNVAREKWKSDNLKVVKVFSLFCLLPVIFYASLISLYSLIILAHLFFLAILYVIPIKWKGKYYSFRKVPLLKIFILSYVWSWVTVVLPAIESDFLNSAALIVLFAERFVFILAISVSFDIRDYERDEAQQTLTFPLWLGVEKARLISLLLILVFICFSFSYYEELFISTSRVISGLLACIFILKAHRVRDEVYFLIFLDGVIPIHFLVIWISKELMV